MTKCTHDSLRDVLDALAINPVYTTAAARCGVSTKSLWRWLRASQREDDPASFRLMWCDVEDWLHNHIKHAMRLTALTIEAVARDHALRGFDEVQVFQGRICWKEDPKLAGLSDDELARLGHRDRYERNPDGSLIPLTVRRKPSDQLVLKMLSAHFPRTYGDRVDHQHNGIIAVMRVGRDGKMRPNSPAITKLEDDELVASADSGGDIEPARMKVGLVVGEPACNSEELTRMSQDLKKFGVKPIEFIEEDGSVTRMEADGTVTVVTPAAQEPVVPAAPKQDRGPPRRGVNPQTSASMQTTGPANELTHEAPGHLPADGAGPLRSRPLPGGYRIC
jgi:hypothetical protein